MQRTTVSSTLVSNSAFSLLIDSSAQLSLIRVYQIEHTTFDFSDPKIERLVALTSADRRWMDEIVKTVEETWNPEDPTRPTGMVFRGSDDFLRAKVRGQHAYDRL
jgi:hypothetical protein